MSRILFLVSSMQGGGAERVAALLSNHWVAQAHEVVLMPTFSGRGECLYPLDERVRLDYLADRVGQRGRSGLNQLRRFVVLRKAMREIAPDVIVSFLPHVNVAAVLAASGLGIPVVVSERIHPPTMPLGKFLERLRRIAYPRASHVVVQTSRTLRWLEEHCVGAHGRVIPNPVAYPLPHGQPGLDPDSVLPEGRSLILAVGRLVPQKGFNALLLAFAEQAHGHPDWDLVILGDGPGRERLEAQRCKLGLSDRIYFPGYVGNPGDWYARAHLYVMSSRFEGFPNTLAEAMGHGLPAVSFDCETGPADIIRDGVDGYLVPLDQGAEGLSRAMAALMSDDARREKMGCAAISVRERFSPERIMAAWDQILGLRQEN